MLSNLKIPKELRRKIENELQPGEFIRWVEQPIPRFSQPLPLEVFYSLFLGLAPSYFLCGVNQGLNFPI
jgi:hypothetical protein